MEKESINPREWLGKQIREYRFTDIIGSGGMSAVFKATHTKLRVDRAVKVLRPDLAGDPQFVHRFEQEARILAVLEHPHLIRVYEFFEEKGYLFIVMEIAEGDSLDDLVLYHGVIPAKEMFTIAAQAADGLEYAHKKGIVHRDLSPDNIMVAGYDEGKIRVKVIDFGIARQDAMDSQSKKIMETGTTTSGAFLGKFRYCSPEQAMEMPVDQRSDQYSLALIFFESITGKPAFEGGGPVTMLMRRVNEPPPRLTDLVPGSSWPTELERVLDRAMQSSPAERYSDMSAFSGALAKSLDINLNKDKSGEDKPGPRKRKYGQNDVTDEGKDELILGITGLAESMDMVPDRTIYPGKSPVTAKPRHGTVQAPPPPKKYPWKRILCVLFLIAVCGGYFLLPEDEQNLVRTKAGEYTDESMKTVMNLFSKEPTATPTSVPVVKPGKRKRQPGSNKEPFWMERKGVVKPVALNSAPIEMPFTLEEEFPPPMKVTVQCIVLKDGQLMRATVMNTKHPILDRLAVEAVKSWRYTPGSFKGAPADIICDIDVVFD